MNGPVSQLHYTLDVGGPAGTTGGFDDLAAVLFGDDAMAAADGEGRADAEGRGDAGLPPWFGPRRADDADRRGAADGTTGSGTAVPGGADGESAADRRARIERLRHAVRVDAYDNDLKLSIAVDRLLERAVIAPPPATSARRA
jgi:hypothetical protein